MRPIYIIIPTLNKQLGHSIGKMAQATAGCPSTLLVMHDVKRQGFTKTVNEGIRLAPPISDICLLNDDVTWYQWNWLEIQRRVLHSKHDIGLTGPTGDCGAVPIRNGLLGDFGTLAVGHISFWCVLMKREMIEQIGLLDEAFIHYNSDSWYCKMMKRTGWKAVWVKSVFLKHKKHGSGKIVKWREQDIETYRSRR